VHVALLLIDLKTTTRDQCLDGKSFQTHCWKTSTAKTSRQRKTPKVSVSVFITVVPENIFEQKQFEQLFRHIEEPGANQLVEIHSLCITSHGLVGTWIIAIILLNNVTNF